MRTFLLAIVFLSGCGGPATGPLREPDEYTGCATDEHWRTFDDQEKFAMVSDAQAPSVTMPAEGASVPFAMKPTFTWTESGTAPGMPLGDVAHDGPACASCCPEWNTGAITTMHLPPVSGDVYDLQFSSGGKVFYRVLTTIQEWLPPDVSNSSMIQAWQSFKGKQVTLKIWRMTLLRNDLVPGTPSGPFVATQPFTFSVGN
ncbi:MAG: hypothetical protein ACHQ17_08105 [Polyangia bacterium]|jgi:hypothetical protein